jgi:hypothetical protein
MSEHGNGSGRPERRVIADAVAARRRAQLVSGLRGLAKPGAGTGSNGAGTGSNGNGLPSGGGPAPLIAGTSGPASAGSELCDICGVDIPDEHRHLLHLVERRILCACESCWGMRSGEGDYRPTGARTMWLADLDLPDDLWASFQIPIGLAFFMESTVSGCVVAMYPSPVGATESELHFESWQRMCGLNPVLVNLEADIEGLVVNRLSDPPAYLIAPIDKCYELTGIIKASWEGISGGAEVETAVAGFFERLRAQAVTA